MKEMSVTPTPMTEESIPIEDREAMDNYNGIENSRQYTDSF